MRTYFSGNLSEAHAERFLEELAIELRLKFDILEYLMDRFPWDLIDNPFLFGNHRMEGILIAHGRNIRKGHSFEEARLIDLAPTVLHLLGDAVPKDMDGRVLTELFTDDFASSRRIRWRDTTEGPGREAPTKMTLEDEATILERLKGLGYI